MRVANVLIVGLTFLATRPCEAGSDDYVRVVKPILAKHCVTCHGVERPKAGLRLDTAERAIAGGKGGPAVVPGKADDSLLYLAVTGDAGIDRMPLKRPPLAPDQVEAIRAWIDAGADVPSAEVPSVPPVHWSFVAPRRPDLPPVKDEGWVRNPIDRFILAPLERDRLTPSPEADRVTLIRRAHLDLIGLPPSPAEVDAFLKDDTRCL
jgi:mono/diheme cytochrome c family protein